MNASDWSAHLKACLESTQFMALATSGPDGLWNHAVYFAWDHDINLYFISKPKSRHMGYIAGNSNVAVAIFSTDQSPTGDVMGLQVRGLAEILPDAHVPSAHEVYFGRAPVIEGIPHELPEFLGPQATWKLVQVRPQEVGYFNSALFGAERQTVPRGTRV